MILGGLHWDLLRRVINGITLKCVLTGFVRVAGVCLGSSLNIVFF